MHERSGATHTVDVAVVGAGLVGLAAARALVGRHPGRRLVVLEKEAGVARHQSGHNSGVLHQGLYYRPGSAKARLCRSGVETLSRYVEEREIPHAFVGKVVVATDQRELAALDGLEQRALANGVPELTRIGPERLRELEPHAGGLAALHSPRTGIVDYRAVARSYADDVAAGGGEVLIGAGLRRAARRAGRWHLATGAGEVDAGHVVNCAGLHADRVARLLGVEPDVRIVPFRGEYHHLTPEREHLVRGLIYPVPDPALPFLGVHLTRLVGGGVEAGPNAVLALAREGYTRWTVDARDLAATLGWPGFWKLAARHARTGVSEFVRSLRRAWVAKSLSRLVPDLVAQDIVPAGAGVRAQAVDRAGRLVDDFVIRASEDAVHVLNAPSPAATASLAIGEHVATEAGQAFGWT